MCRRQWQEQAHQLRTQIDRPVAAERRSRKTQGPLSEIAIHPALTVGWIFPRQTRPLSPCRSRYVTSSPPSPTARACIADRPSGHCDISDHTRGSNAPKPTPARSLSGSRSARPPISTSVCGFPGFQEGFQAATVSKAIRRASGFGTEKFNFSKPITCPALPSSG